MSSPINPKAKGPIAVWQEPQIVRFGVIDRSDRLTLDAVFQLFQEAAISHAENLGVGREDMARTGQVWILSRMSVQIDRRPGYGEALTIRSWPRGGEKLFALRDFDMLDVSNKPVVRARSGWIILDKDKRRPLRPQSVMGGLPLNNGLDALPSGAAELAERPSLKKVMDRKALYTDVDYNGHVNNVKYIQWIEDALASQHLEKAGQMRLDINYLTEVLPNENIALWTAPFTDQARSDAPDLRGNSADTPAAPVSAAYAIEGRKDGGAPAFRAELRLWEGEAHVPPKKYAKKMGNPFMRIAGNIDKDRLNIILAAALLLSLAANIFLGVRSCSSSAELRRLRQVELDWIAAEEARLEAERLAAEEAARLEAERFEAERRAAEEAARLAAEEEARRLAAEAASRRSQQGAPRPQPAAQYSSTESNPGNAFVGTWSNDNKSIVFRMRNNGSIEALNFNIVDELVDVRFREMRGRTGGGFWESQNRVANEYVYTGTGTYTVNGDEVTFNLSLKNTEGAVKDFSHKTKFFFENANKTLKLANGIPRKFRLNRQTRQEVTHERSREYFSTAFTRQ